MFPYIWKSKHFLWLVNNVVRCIRIDECNIQKVCDSLVSRSTAKGRLCFSACSSSLSYVHREDPILIRRVGFFEASYINQIHSLWVCRLSRWEVGCSSRCRKITSKKEDRRKCREQARQSVQEFKTCPGKPPLPPHTHCCSRSLHRQSKEINQFNLYMTFLNIGHVFQKCLGFTGSGTTQNV